MCDLSVTVSQNDGVGQSSTPPSRKSPDLDKAFEVTHKAADSCVHCFTARRIHNDSKNKKGAEP